MGAVLDDEDLPQGHVLPTLDVDSGTHALQQVGSYEVVKPVCTDTTARLYLARNTRLARLVTLQEILLPDPSDTAGAVELVQKARKASRLKSPHLVEIYDYLEQTHDHFCAVMEPLFGETLRARISRRDLTIREAVELTHQIAACLTTLHASGRVHASLASSWVFLAEGERGARSVKLIDYGLGTDQQQLLELEEQAPEQRASQPVGTLTDVYFLGSLLFEMLEGKRPFDMPVTSNQSPAGEHLPPSLQAVVAQSLKPNPAHRYPTVDVFCAAVTEALDPSYLEPPKPKQRRVMPWLMAAAVVGAIVGAAAWLSQPAEPEQQPAPLPATVAIVPAPAPPPAEVKVEPAPETPSLPPYANLLIGGALMQVDAQLLKLRKTKKSRRR